MPLGAREQELSARFLLAHPERIAVFIKQHRWEELAALADFAARDAPDALAQTDPALYRALRQQITDYRIRGWGQLNSGRLRELASKSVGTEMLESRRRTKSRRSRPAAD